LHDRATVKQKNHRQLALSGGHRVSDELNPIRHVGFSGRPASDTARRVARETAARRRRSAQRGQGRPKRAFNAPALAHTHPRSIFTSPRLFFTTAQPPSTRHAIAVAAAPPRSLALTAIPFAN